MTYSPQSGPNHHVVQAHYRGDTTHAPTTGGTSVTVTAPVTPA